MNNSSEEWHLEPSWSDHLELAEQQAPKGLQNHAKTWMQPDTLCKVTASLTALDQFFWKMCQTMEQAVLQNNDDENETVSTFLDTTIQEVIRAWLGPSGMPFQIFPDHEGEEDEFSDAKMIQLIRNILKGVQPTPLVAPSAPISMPSVSLLPAPAPISVVPSVPLNPPAPVVAPAPPAPVGVAAPTPAPPAPVGVAAPTPAPLAPVVPPITPTQDLSGAKPLTKIRSSLAYRRKTIRLRGRRALTPIRNRAKTRRAKPISPVGVETAPNV